MQRPTPHSWLTTAILVACLLSATSAGAQVGTALTPINAAAFPNVVEIGFSGNNQADTATLLGGVTLFAASAPNGPLLVRIPFLPPYSVQPDSSVPDAWIFPGVPPGTYYLALVYGLVQTPNIPTSAWTRLVVPGACGTAPGIGLVDREVAGGAPDTVRLFLSAVGGCATSYLVEAGTTAGAANVASLEHNNVLLVAGAVPPGNYYVRVRGRNQFGIGPYSEILPVPVPACPPGWTELGSNLTATVVGNHVTLAWTTPTPAPQVGGPITYYEIAHVNGGPPSSPPPRYLVPNGATSFSATVPSGHYLVALFAGNNCRSDTVASVIFDVP